MNITAEMLAALSPELRREMQRRMFALLAELGVQPKITPTGERVFNIGEVAPALGMSLAEATTIAEEAGTDGLLTVDPATLRSVQ